MRNTALMGLGVLILVALATSIVPALADSTDPQPGYTYYVIYRQTDGSIVVAVGCPPSPAYCTPKLQPGQSVMYITDNPTLVKQLFADAHNAKLGAWRVNLQTNQLQTTVTTSSGTVAPVVFGLSLFGTILPATVFVGIATSSGLIWKKVHRHA